MLQILAAALSDARIIAAYVIFLASYLVFALGKLPGFKIDRPGAAIIGAAAMVAARVVAPAQALHFIDFSTIVLLFSMMLIVGNLHLVGFFEWIAERSAALLQTPRASSNSRSQREAKALWGHFRKLPLRQHGC